jgi:hypothetical protein
MIDNYTENSPDELTLFPKKGKNIDLSFSGDHLRSDMISCLRERWPETEIIVSGNSHFTFFWYRD